MAEKESRHGYVFTGKVLHSGKEYAAGSPCPSELVANLLPSGVIKKPLPVEKESAPKIDDAPEKKLAEILKSKEKNSEE